MKLRIALAAIVLTTAVALAQGGGVSVNGRPARSIRSNGETYVAVSDLQKAGAQVTTTSSAVSIRFLPYAGGANQVTAVEGAPDEWLFNGIWRVRVSKIAPITKPFSDGTPGWGLDIEVRNGSKKEVSLFQTGVGLPTLALDNDTVLKADEGDWQRISFRNLLPGASVSHQLKFYLPHGTKAARKARRLVLPIDVKFGLLKDTGLSYSVPAPTFRVTLK